MYEDIKWIANAFRIKCGKYSKEELTPKLCDILFEEAYKEYMTFTATNSLSSEKTGVESILNEE